MKFVPCQAVNTEGVDEISSDEDDHSRKAPSSKHPKKSFASKPLIVRVPYLSILIEQEPQKHANLTSAIIVQESDSEDLYILPSQNAALNSPSEQVAIVRPTQKIQTCTICLQDIKLPAAKINCGHIFCGQCIIQSSKLSNKCPNCRARFKKIVMGSKIVKVKNKTYESETNFDDEPCYVCGRNDRQQELLVCDHCQFAFCHASCDSRLEGRVPSQDWFCLDCTLMGRHLC